MKTNPVRHKLNRGEASFGTWLTLPNVFTAQPKPGGLEGE